MKIGQEFKHSVTTTVTSENQSIVNATTLTENGAVIINSSHEVNIPLGATYEIDVTGDINGRSIVRNLNVLNNLLGDDVFTFKDSNGATDTDLTHFTAAYDADLMQFSGTAGINALVRVMFEDGSSKTGLADSLGAWKVDIESSDLEYGLNSIVLFTGTRSDQVKVISIKVDEPVIPFDPAFTYQVNAAGTVISGTAQDNRALVKLRFGQVTQTALVNPDKTWQYELVTPLSHGDSFDIYVGYLQESSAIDTHVFYKNSATLDAKGQFVSGLCAPGSNVQVTTAKYQTVIVIPNAAGEWITYFTQGLPAGEAVVITINDEVIETLTYSGEANVIYTLTVNAVDSVTVSGTGRPGGKLTVNAGQGIPLAAIIDSLGNWTVLLNAPLVDGEQITVISDSGQDVTIYFEAPFVPVYTAYISNDGLMVFGTSNTDHILVTLPGQAEQQIAVNQGEWTMTLDAALNANDLVTVGYGDSQKTLQFIGIQAFTAELSAEKDKVTGTTDAGVNAVIRIVFDDNAVIEKPVSGGVYELALGRVLEIGQVIVVACTNEHGVQSAISIDVE